MRTAAGLLSERTLRAGARTSKPARDMTADPVSRSAAEYLRFAEVGVRGKSAIYEGLCIEIAKDRPLLERLAALPRERQQPNLLLAAVQFLFSVPSDYKAFRSLVLGNWAEISTVIHSRRTQTNEVGRCAPLVCLLGELPQPLALIEVGASAGLCLLADCYSYRYGGWRIGDGTLELECEVHGPAPLPCRVPEVTWRAGIDLDPLDVRDEQDVRWLEALVWPEEQDRRERLEQATALARQVPPRLIRGDMVDLLPTVAAEAPADATLVVFHTAALTYLPRRRRREFEATVTSLPVVWISQEEPGVAELNGTVTAEPVAPAYFVSALDGRPRLLMDSHGRWLQALE